MFKNVKVHYPKKKTAIHEPKVQGMQEPARETMYDIVLQNLRIADRNTFVHRIMYVGEHTFPGENDMIIDYFQNSIDRVNECFCLEKLTGFLLCYRRHFVHMIEGDEDSIHAHLDIVLNDKNHKNYIGVIKLLIHFSHINRRYIADWVFYKGMPPKLLEQIDLNSSLEDSGRQIYNCIKKVYNLVASYVDDNYYSLPAGDKLSGSLNEALSLSSSHDDSSASRSRRSQMSFRPTSSLLGAVDPYRAYLPETEVLNFIIGSTFTQPLSLYHEKYGVVPQRDIYKDKVWPVPCDFIPYDVFTKPYDTITELPKPVVKTETDIIPDNSEQNEGEKQEDDMANTNNQIEANVAENGSQKNYDENASGANEENMPAHEKDD